MSIPLLAPGLAAEIFDSAALSGTALVSHPMPDLGEWRASTTVGRMPLPARTVLVLREGGAAMIPLEPGGEAEQRLHQGGHIRLRAPNGGALAATLTRAGSTDPAWTSRELQDGDWFGCMPLRPGRYRLTNRLSQAEALVVVRYPDPRIDRDPTQHAEPVRIRAGGGFGPDQVEIFPGQPLVIQITAPAHLVLALFEPDDGPADLAAWRARHDAEALAKIGARRHRAAEG